MIKLPPFFIIAMLLLAAHSLLPVAGAFAQSAEEDLKAKDVEFQNSINEFNKMMNDFGQDHSVSGSGSSSSNISSVVIGSQTWAVANLDVTAFRNGDAIAEVKTDAEWEKAYEDKKPAWCYYNNDPSNGSSYGKLYNWWAVTDKRGLSPSGWRIPLKSDWQKLGSQIGGSSFAFRPGGSRQTGSDTFTGIGTETHWWTSEINMVMGFEMGAGLKLSQGSSQFVADSYAAEGLYVRCIKD